MKFSTKLNTSTTMNSQEASPALPLSRLWIGATSLVAALASFVWIDNAAAALPTPPDRMSYQGFLVDNSATPLGNTSPANYTTIFRIYDTAEGANLIWSEQQVVTVDKGNFSVVLGEGTSVSGEPRPTLSSIFASPSGGERFLATTVTISGTPVTLAPRIRLLPSAYAFLSTAANKLLKASDGAPFLDYSSGTVVVDGVVQSSGGFNGLTAAQVPSLDAAKITTGSFNEARIPTTLLGNRTFQSGNVGIGTSSTAYQLSLGGNLANTKLAMWDGGSGNAFGFGIQGGQFRFHVNHSGDRFSFLNAPAGTEVMTIQGGGNVGIGVNPPGYKLHVNGQAYASDVFWGSGSAHLRNDQGGSIELGSPTLAGAIPYIDFRRGGGNPDYDARIILSGHDTLDIQGAHLVTGNRIGIGTSTPRSPLDITSFNGIGVITFAYFARSGSSAVSAFASTPHDPGNYSITANGRVWALEFNAHSDSRIKNVLGVSDSQSDLDLINKLVVKDYLHVDTIANGSTRKKGFIAQEVQKVLPEAVTSNTNRVPDVYQLPDSFEYSQLKKELLVNLPKPHSLKKGDSVQVFADTNRFEWTVAAVPSSTNIIFGKIDSKPGKLFLYGREVPDFLTLNYDHIFVTGIGAIQQLHKHVLNDQTRIASLEKKAAKVDALELEVITLKKQLAAQQEAASALEARFTVLEKTIKTAQAEPTPKNVRTAQLNR